VGSCGDSRGAVAKLSTGAFERSLEVAQRGLGLAKHRADAPEAIRLELLDQTHDVDRLNVVTKRAHLDRLAGLSERDLVPGRCSPSSAASGRLRGGHDLGINTGLSGSSAPVTGIVTLTGLRNSTPWGSSSAAGPTVDSSSPSSRRSRGHNGGE